MNYQIPFCELTNRDSAVLSFLLVNFISYNRLKMYALNPTGRQQEHDIA